MKVFRSNKETLRVVKIGREAIQEIIQESLMEGCRTLLARKNKKSINIHLVVNDSFSEAFFYEYRIKDQEKIDFEKVDDYIKHHLENTTSSIYTPPESGVFYAEIKKITK